MAELTGSSGSLAERFKRWLLEGQVERRKGPHEEQDEEDHARKQPWWRVTCLTGVNYFRTT